MITNLPIAWRASVWVLGGAMILSACGGGGSSHSVDAPDDSVQYQATIERTTYGIPHITADTYGGVGYGHGYAIAEDNLCVLAGAFVTFRGERSRYFGPSDSASPMGTFGSPPNLEADFFFRSVVDDDRVSAFRDAQNQDLRQLAQGFAVGFSRYVREVQAGEHVGRHLTCRDQPWLSTIVEDDVFRRLVALNLAASSANWVEEISSAQPPSVASARSRATSMPEELELDQDRFRVGRELGIGSNTLAFGGDATESGGGLLLGNPHWYLQGVDRFYQLQLTIPGKLDVSGATIMGAPMVLLGFNDDIAWAHTVSTARRFTLYQLSLVEGDPTRYIKDGQETALQSTEITVQVKQDDDSLMLVTRTLYRSEYGPMINLAGLGLPAWDTDQAFTLRDVNLENDRAFENFFAFNHASSLDDFYAAIKKYVGIPWVNTSAIGRGDDRALYSDITAVPNVPDSMLGDCLVPGYGPAVMQMVPGLPLLDGSRSACDWKNDADAAQQGAFGPSKLPSLFRSDYVANMNDSHWLSNPEQPLSGFDGIIGQEDYPQNLRTRMGHTLAAERLAGLDGLSGNKASSENLRDIVLNSRVYSAELLKDEVLGVVCDGTGSAEEQQACQVLQNWDNTGNLDAAGAHLWTALWNGRLEDIEGLYATHFDAENAVNTPSGLNVDVLDAVKTTFSEAVAEVVESGVEMDATVGSYQSFFKPGTDIPQYGGEGNEGYFTVLRNTYMHVVDFPEGEPVRAYTLLSHAEATDPTSPYYQDYTEAYSGKQWHRVPFTREQIEAQRLSIIEISE